MDANRWKQLKQLLAEAIEREGSERDAFIDEACSDDSTLRDELISLIEASEGSDSFLEDSTIARPVGSLPDDPVDDGTRRIGPYRHLPIDS